MEQDSGYWGNVTSSVDWCEINYEVSYYIAEFWNTVSSFAMVALGLLGVYLHHAALGWNISIGYLLIVLVGFGSVLFHATLKFENQMWDELPMCWTACYMLWVLLQEHGYASRPLGVGIAVYCAAITWLVSGFRGSQQFITFHITFGAVMWTCFLFVLKTYRESKAGALVRQLLQRGALCLLLAAASWLVDLHLCFLILGELSWLPNPQLHAWWHIVMCMALHYFFVGCSLESEVRKGHDARVVYFAGFIPYVAVKTK